jgi:hypothetical protein
MAAINQSKLTPQQQSALFEMMKQSGQQPTSGGVPMAQAPSAPAYEGQGQLQQLQEQPQVVATPQMPAPGSFANDPQGAIQFISQMMQSKATGHSLQAGKDGSLNARVPVDQPLLRLLGMKRNEPVGPNFLDTFRAQAGDEQAARLLPQGLPKTPDGMPYLGKEGYEILRQGVSKEHGEYKPSKAVGEAMKQKAKDLYGESDPTYQSIAEAIDSMGGLPLSNTRLCLDRRQVCLRYWVIPLIKLCLTGVWPLMTLTPS